jgi:hypothetical protein
MGYWQYCIVLVTNWHTNGRNYNPLRGGLTVVFPSFYDHIRTSIIL